MGSQITLQRTDVDPAECWGHIDLLDLSIVKRLDLSIDEHLVPLDAVHFRDGKHHAFGVRVAGKIHAVLFLNISSRCNRFWLPDHYRLFLKHRRKVCVFYCAFEIVDALCIFVCHHHILEEREDRIQVSQDDIFVRNCP